MYQGYGLEHRVENKIATEGRSDERKILSVYSVSIFASVIRYVPQYGAI